MESDGIPKLKSHVITEVVAYQPNAIVSKTIIKKPTGDIMVMSFDAGTTYKEQVSPFDTLFQIIDGNAEIKVNGKVSQLKLGSCIVIPAHHQKIINAKERFKMIVAIIKSGYE